MDDLRRNELAVAVDMDEDDRDERDEEALLL
jgi:hypothetical protein